jgi:GT2 family glycosyltransferase
MTIDQFEMPFVTLIMPVRNEAAHIEGSLGSLLTQTYPAEQLQILVCDGQSTDDTRQRIKALNQVHPQYDLRIIDNPKRVMPAGFNLGFRQATGEIIIVVGGHCHLTADYVTNCVKALKTTGASCVGGPIVTTGMTSVAKAIALAQSSRFGVGGVAFRRQATQGQYVDTVAFGAYRREVFDQIGILDEELVRNQDDEFNFRLTQAGGKIWLDPSIQSTYYSRATLQKLWRQYFDYGLYKVRVIQKRGAVPSWRHLVPGAFVLTLLFSLLLSIGFNNSNWILLPLLSYCLATLAAAFLTAGRQWTLVFGLLPAFWTLHFAYGTGFLYGLWRWRKHEWSRVPKVAPTISL